MIPAASYVKNSASVEGIPKRILVIDDEPLIRWALSVGLAGAGYDAVAAADAVEARRVARMWPRPDVVLLDLHQADCSRLLAELREIAPGCHVLVLGTCCEGRSISRWEGFEVIAKPFDLVDIVKRVAQAINEGQAQPAS